MSPPRGDSLARSTTAGGSGRAWHSALLCLALAGGTIGSAAADADAIIFPAGNAGTTSRAGAAGDRGGGNSWTLLLAVPLASAGVWLVWRQRHRRGLHGGTASLTVNETRALGNRQYLVVASYEGRKFLLGVCPGRIDLLAPLTTDGSRRE